MRGKKNESEKLHVLDSHKRVNFLHQSAVQISMKSSNNNDSYSKISRVICKHIREILNTERVKVSPDFNRTICKKCRQMLVSKTPRCELKLIQKKVLQRKCLHCQNTQNYEINKTYLSRNEKAKMENKITPQ
ncbi:unnamed protein product [Auanema sp. JU1783]|nr:unnamed protein product [Auanema sp. JU1783]